MFKIIVDYPSDEEDLKILQTMGVIENRANLAPVVKAEQILNARKVVDQIHIAENIQKYIVSLILSTRNPENYGMKDLKGLIEFGASPRATIYMSIAAKAAAFMSQRGYVIPEDIREVGRAILRHRIILTYEAEAEDITTEDIITRIFESIPTP
jgi:MoxR-like ATPase